MASSTEIGFVVTSLEFQLFSYDVLADCVAVWQMFAWHVEDNYLASLNYHHRGAPKTWYGIPARCAYEVESVVHNQVQGVHEQDVLASKNIIVPPVFLKKHKIPVYQLVQHPGEFVVTLPQGFHSGFSHGYNNAEAVNLALPGWLGFGATSMIRYRHIKKESVIDVEELACVVAGISETWETPALEPSLDDYNECLDILAQEVRLRDQYSTKYGNRVVDTTGKALAGGQRWTCSICKVHDYHNYIDVCVWCFDIFIVVAASLPFLCPILCRTTRQDLLPKT